jgi:hypothetical protein
MGQEIHDGGNNKQISPAEPEIPGVVPALPRRPEATAETQRVRNTAAMMRAHRKVARERIVRSRPS